MFGEQPSGNLAKKNLRESVLQNPVVKNTSKLVLRTRLVPQILGELVLRNQAAKNASGLGFTKIYAHLSKEGTVSHLIIERTSLYVQTLKVLVCTDFDTPWGH